jgi:hypothetical protein
VGEGQGGVNHSGQDQAELDPLPIITSLLRKYFYHVLNVRRRLQGGGGGE